MEYRVYLSGQITGLTFEEAKANFDKAEEKVANILLTEPYKAIVTLIKEFCEEKTSLVCVNPMKLEHKEDSTWEDYMEKDIAELLKCSAIYMINNWEQSKGARVEHAIAIELGLPVLYQSKYEVA